MSKKMLGVQSLLYEELLKCDPDEYKRLLRVSSTQFFELLARVQHRIERQETTMKPSVPAKTRLQIALRFLATGETHYSLSRQFRVEHSTVNQLIEETCVAIYLELKDEFLKTPKTGGEWSDVMQDFKQKW
ncbi:uncharacterized protein [Dermacentor albipictus]|uniref:uncharacterized protein n=1 Tax=Dermacentor albipictus TaxID=60249 RepID=UPI0038FCD857